MKTKHKLMMGTLFFIATMAISGLSMAQSNTAKKADPKKHMHNEKLVTEAYSSGYAEVKISESIKDRTTSPEIKELATMMISDHTNLNSKLKSLAAAEKITLTSELTNEQQNSMDKLMKKSGSELDAAYVDMLMASHKKSVDLYEKGSRCDDDAEIKAFFTDALPKIKSHRDHVARLDEQYKKDSKTGSMKMEE